MDSIDRVNEQIKREIGVIIQQELADPRLRFVTITSVDVSRDLRTAKVYFSALAGRLPSAEGSSPQGTSGPRGGGDKPAAEAARQAPPGATGDLRRRGGGDGKRSQTP